jgi:hypothetical protein
VRATVLVPIAAALLLLAACSGEDESAPAGSVPSEPPASTGASERATTTKPKPKPGLEDGRHFGYLQAARVTADPRELVFDQAYFLIGEEANAAAEDRGLETPVPNDYLIVNDNPKLRTLPASNALVIDLLDWKRCCEKRLAGDPAQFETAFTAQSPPAGRYRGSFSAYWLTVEDGVVTRIEEQYLP